jgi:hypothetical protein
MSRLATYIDLRKHPRAQLRLPARIRWRSPLGMRLEISQTIDVSREGLLVHRAEPCEVNSRVWVAFPFETSNAISAQPEIPARVVRTQSEPTGGLRVALQLQLPPRRPPHPPGQERRASSRVPFAVPIFVRAAATPWPEESMTQDVSRSGVRFVTARIFTPGDSVFASISWGEWARKGELPARVVRVEEQPDSPGSAPLADPSTGTSAVFTSVAIAWEKPAKT